MSWRSGWLWKVLLLSFFLNFGGSAKAGNGSEFLGEWLFYKMIYKGERIEPLNPNLVMTFTFSEVGTNSVRYYRTDEAGFCERAAIWTYDEGKKELHQQVTWANPENRADCAADPDFQIGHVSYSPFRMDQDQLYLTVSVSDEALELVWKRVTP